MQHLMLKPVWMPGEASLKFPKCRKPKELLVLEYAQHVVLGELIVVVTEYLKMLILLLLH